MKAVCKVASIGRSLNQLVRGMHAGQVAVTPFDQALVEEIRKRVDAVKEEFYVVIDPAIGL